MAVEDLGTPSPLQETRLRRDGYIFVYVSNESNFDVFFDNLQVIHKPGPLLEETHYYPFGLTMAGISSKAFGGVQNKFGITGKEKQYQEFADGSGLEEYDFGARFQDPQLGRWNQVDPMVANYYWLSPYNYCNDNPVKYLDPNGMEFKDTTINNKKGRYDVATLQTVSVMGKSKKQNSLADRGLFWANLASSESAKRHQTASDLYGQARGDGFTQEQMFKAWKKDGVDEYDLMNFELAYQSYRDWRTMSLVSVGVLGAPVLGTSAPELVSALEEQSVIANAAIRNIGIDTYGYTNLLLNKLISGSLESIANSLPESMIGLSKILSNMSGKPVDIFTQENIYKAIKFYLKRKGYEGLPESDNIFLK